ncbi:hypothetical protein GCM10009678_21520 [Actinomadura kijaniata]|uniref:DUF397 domain-containing protein n=1 Tax=Actinomadura kijaniata TaxID=46161 RepID=UPI0016037C2C|nr:DUF397 domain-containing protein [Actinomadura namibiensis]
MDLSAVRWRKSSYSGDNAAQCVEVAGLFDALGFRDSKDPEGPKLFIGRVEARGLAERIKGLGAG